MSEKDKLIQEIRQKMDDFLENSTEEEFWEALYKAGLKRPEQKNETLEKALEASENLRDYIDNKPF